MPKINKHLDRIYRCPEEKIPEREKELSNPLLIWYDNLKVNPLLSYFSMDDINQINQISSSVRLNNNPREKYRLIEEIMRKRGFRLIGGGTNRRTYTCDYDSRIVAKVGTDKVGFSNNLREFVNQDVLKPFCCKIFEVSPCGTLAIIESVYPIKTIEEFQSVGEDIFNVLYFKIRNKDIAMEDIGFRSYKNWGIRDNFGPVLLDYPTMYVADPKKCFCTQKDAYGRYCNHPLDYDEGFDNIVCTKCGHRYLSKFISKKNGDNIAELIYAAGNRFNKKKGECKMIIRVKNRNGERVIKNLDNGKSDYVKHQPIQNPVMSNEMYKNTYGRPKHDLGVVIKSNDIKEQLLDQCLQAAKMINLRYGKIDLSKAANELSNLTEEELNKFLQSELDTVYRQNRRIMPKEDFLDILNGNDPSKWVEVLNSTLEARKKFKDSNGDDLDNKITDIECPPLSDTNLFDMELQIDSNEDKLESETINNDITPSESAIEAFTAFTDFLKSYGKYHPQNDEEQDAVLTEEELDVLNKLNKLTTIGSTNNEGISPILKKHFNNIWNYNFDVFGLSKDGVDSFKTAKDMFKLVIESIDGALNFYKKCIKYLEDLWEYSASLCNVEDFCFDFSEETPKVVYNNEVIRINLVKVSKILDLVTIVGFPNGNLNNNVVADRVFEPDFINLSSKISYIGKTNNDMVYPCMHKSKNVNSTKIKVKLVNNDSDENLSNY